MAPWVTQDVFDSPIFRADDRADDVHGDATPSPPMCPLYGKSLVEELDTLLPELRILIMGWVKGSFWYEGWDETWCDDMKDPWWTVDARLWWLRDHPVSISRIHSY